MIAGAHTIIFAEDAERARAFLLCHDIDRTVEQLEAKGVEFVSPIEDEGWGRIARFKIPGAGEIGLYQPQHPSPLAEFARGT